MTATEMYLAFGEQTNQSHSWQIFTFEVANYLNLAQNELFNYYYGVLRDGRTFYQKNQETSEALENFLRVVRTNTNVKGFVARPADLLHLAAINAYTEPSDLCGEHGRRIMVKFMAENEFAAFEDNVFKRPTWETITLPKAAWYRPRYMRRPVGATNAPGFVLFPNRKYDVEISYLIQPPNIAIQNQTGPAAWEQAYSTNPDFINTLSDADSLFPANLHPLLVTKAVALFSKARTDYQGYAVETAKAQGGDN